MDGTEEENSTSDLEELEFALYSQIHYESHSEICNSTDPHNNQISDSNYTTDINWHYDIGVKYVNSSGNSKTGKHDLSVPTEVTQKCAFVEKDQKLCSTLTSKESTALASETFLGLNSKENSMVINSDCTNSDGEERSKTIEVLSKSKKSKSAIAKKSVIETESDSEESIILLSDIDSSDSEVEWCYESVNSEDMLLDEDLSDLEGLHVNVEEEHQPMLSTAYNFEHHQKSWFIIDADRYGTPPQHVKSRYYGNEFNQCYNCKQNGHLSRDCPKPSKLEICILCGFLGHFHKNCQQRACYRCQCPGHQSRDCQEPFVSRWNPCFRCGIQGHTKKMCPNQWRQYHLTTNPQKIQKGQNKKNPRKFCYNCAEEGHYGFECEEERMDQYSSPSYPFIESYNFRKVNKSQKRKQDEEDEEHSVKRAKKVAKEKPVLNVVDPLKEGKKKKSKKLKRIYDRLEVEKLQKKEKKKKSGKSCVLAKSEKNLCVEVTDDGRSVKENVQGLSIRVTKKQGKKNKKLKRINDKIQTEKQKKNLSGKKRYNGTQESGNCNPNRQRMNGSTKNTTGPIKHAKKKKQTSKKVTLTGFDGIPANATKGFKTKFSAKK